MLTAAIERRSGVLVEGFTLPGDEGGRDAERRTVFGVEDVSRGGNIPSSVATGFEGGAEAAIREGRGIGFGLDERLTRELREGAVAVRLEEGVMLLGGEAGERVKDVRVVGRAALECPILNGGSDDVRGGCIQLGARLNVRLKRLEDVLREALLHLIERENILAVDQIDLLVAEVEAALKARLGGNRLDGVAAGWVGAHWGIGKVINYEQRKSTPRATLQ